MSIAENIAEVRESIENSCLRAGRDPHEVLLLAVSKYVDTERIGEAVAAGQKAIPERLLSQVEEDNAFFKLTDRQIGILASVADGQSNSDIAKQLGLSEITIKKHLSSVFRCLGVANRSEAVALALQKRVFGSWRACG